MLHSLGSISFSDTLCMKDVKCSKNYFNDEQSVNVKDIMLNNQ
ncbi:3222_t:CDS:2 [Cetraspora pellucida]|uniref:3222_t:CDS:1 n=1 Tax=Cetraspora pellucida TaxID=1433469 RepID=A0A9N9A1V2_9GLOM|nr:3222_t:CDS:2 [Cetraspora pellucida]